jgi:hypothetical protein
VSIIFAVINPQSSNWNRLFSIALGYGLDSQGTIPGRSKVFFFFIASRLALRPGTKGLFLLGVEWQGHEADHSPPSSAEVKNGGAIPPFLHMLSWHDA